MHLDQDSDCERIINILGRLDIEYEIRLHAPVFTMQDADEIAKDLQIEPCKNLLLCDRKSNFYLMLTPGDKKVDLKEIARQIGSSRLSFADASQMAGLLHTAPGALSPLSLVFDESQKVHLLIDNDIFKLQSIGCHPCSNTCSVKISLKDLLDKYIPLTQHTYQTIAIVP